MEQVRKKSCSHEFCSYLDENIFNVKPNIFNIKPRHWKGNLEWVWKRVLGIYETGH